MDRAARAAERTRPVLPVLRLLEQGQDGLEVPAGVAGLRPAVVVGPVAAGPDHGIDAPRPAEHLAQRQGDGAFVDVRARLITVGPVVAGTGVLPPLRRVRGAGGRRTPPRSPPPRAGERWRPCRPPGGARPPTPPTRRPRSRSRNFGPAPCRARPQDDALSPSKSPWRVLISPR